MNRIHSFIKINSLLCKGMIIWYKNCLNQKHSPVFSSKVGVRGCSECLHLYQKRMPHRFFLALPNNSLLKDNNRNTRKKCEICFKLTIKAPERRLWRLSVIFIVNFQHISHPFVLFLLSTLNKDMFAGSIALNQKNVQNL